MFSIFKKKTKKSLSQTVKFEPYYMYRENIIELYNWLQGEREGYLLADGHTWINYGELNDKFPYDENDKQRELSRNHMIDKTIRKMKELELIYENEECVK